MAKISGQTIGKIAGGAFIALVGTIFVVLGASKVRVDQGRTLPPGHDIYACAIIPSYVVGDLANEQAFWRKHKTTYGKVRINDPCETTCVVNNRSLPCHHGAITISLRDQPFSETHADETIVATNSDGSVAFVTILLPEKIFSIEEIGAPSLPKDVYALALAHALGHAENYGHSYTPIMPGFIGEKTGELMNSSVEKWGWGDAGLPK